MSQLPYWLAGTLGRRMIEGLMATVRFSEEGQEHYRRFRDAGEPVIYALWHGRLLPLTYLHRHRGVTALISQSADGEYIARVVEAWGYGTVRGSTSRGAAQAIRGLVKATRSGQSLAITPDGPRGPRQRLQPGVITVAQLAGLPIIPAVCGATRAWWPGSWDRFCVPKPFARVRAYYGPPRWVDRDATEGERVRLARELEAELNAMVEKADEGGGPDR